MTLHKAIYGELYRCHAGIKQLVKHPTDEMQKSVGIRCGYPQLMAYQLWAADFYYKQLAGRLEILDHAVEPYLLKDMAACAVPYANVSYDGKPARFSACRQYSICPHCRMRVLSMAYHALLPFLSPSRKIAILRPFASSLHGKIIDKDTITRLVGAVDEIYELKRNAGWLADAVIPIPKRNRQTYWCAMALIVAVMENTAELWDPETVGILDCEWKTREATPEALANCLAIYGSYSPALLTNYMSAAHVASIRSAMGPVRLRKHGFLSTKKLEICERSFDVEDNGMCFEWRPASAAPDLEPAAGDQERCLRVSTADSAVLRGSQQVLGSNGGSLQQRQARFAVGGTL